MGSCFNSNFQSHVKTLGTLAFFTLLSLAFQSCDGVVGKGEVGETFLRLAKVKSLKFEKPSQAMIESTLIPAIKDIPEFSGNNYRFKDSVDAWTVAKDGRYLIHRGSVHESKTSYRFFVVVYESSTRRPVFYEAGHSTSGTYPSGIKSSP